MSDAQTTAGPLKQRAFPNLNRGPKRKNTPRAGNFIEALFDNGGDVRQAMRDTNIHRFNPNQILNQPGVLTAIARRKALMEKPGGITQADVMENLLRIGDAAEEAGQYAPAIKAQELVGKQIGMFVERNININVDATHAHLMALKAKMEARRHTVITLVPEDPFAGI